MRVCAFIILIATALMSPFPFFLFCAFLYVFFWTGFEILILTAVIDALFGMSSTSCMYTVSIGTILVLAEVLRPYMSWYTIQI